MPEQVNNSFRLVVIDGARTVCTDSTGDLPLWQITIDPSKCSFTDLAGGPTMPPITPGIAAEPFAPPPAITPVPEPSAVILMALGLTLACAWRRVAR